MTSFKTLGLTKSVFRGVQAAGYTQPTPIQAAAIPLALSGRDIIGCAQTGTGKTAAFVLPVLDALSRHKGHGHKESDQQNKSRHEHPRGRNDRRHRGRNTKRKDTWRPVRALIVVPTRELALQVDESIRMYGRYTGLRSLAVFGGTGIQPQIQQLRRGVDIIVATPGRLMDHMDRKTVRLSSVTALVLDEADRMLDMGFIPDIRKIVAALPSERHTMLFSATMPPAVRKLADELLQDAEYMEMGKRRNPAKTVKQRKCAVLQENKMQLLTHILDDHPVENVIVFSRTKHRADRIARKLSRKGFATAVLHSNRTQAQRQKALKGFRAGKYQIMIATNIAARGIDVDNISHVINYDTPEKPEEYIHRIGRTGRAETTGDAITFVGEGEITYLKDIERHIGKKLKRMECDGITEMEGHPITIEQGSGRKKGAGSYRKSRRGGPRSYNKRKGKPGGRSKSSRQNNVSPKFS